MLTRLTLKTYQPTMRFTLDDGQLNEVKLDRSSDRKISGSRWVKVDAAFATDSLGGTASPRSAEASEGT